MVAINGKRGDRNLSFEFKFGDYSCICGCEHPQGWQHRNNPDVVETRGFQHRYGAPPAEDVVSPQQLGPDTPKAVTPGIQQGWSERSRPSSLVLDESQGQQTTTFAPTGSETSQPAGHRSAQEQTVSSSPARRSMNEPGEGGGGNDMDPKLAEAVADALRVGQLLEARRIMARISSRDAVEPRDLEQMDRVSLVYDDSLNDLQPDGDGWIEETVAPGMSYKYRIGDGTFQLLSILETEGDIVKALAALMEGDLSKGYKKNIVRAARLESANIYDSVWHIEQKGRVTGRPEDNVAMVNMVDALDEKLGAVWLCMYPLATEVEEVRGVQLPKPPVGSTREANWRTTFQLETIGGSSGTSSKYRFSAALSSTPSPSGWFIISRMPSWGFKMLMRSAANELFTGFTAHAEGCHELHERLSAPFYEHMRRRFARDEPPYRAPSFSSAQPCDTPEISQKVDVGGACSSSSTQTESAVDSADSGDVPDDIVIVESAGVESWAIISAQLPEDWANYCD